MESIKQLCFSSDYLASIQTENLSVTTPTQKTRFCVLKTVLTLKNNQNEIKNLNIISTFYVL